MGVGEITIEQLQERIGTVLGTSDWLLVDQARINQFADATDDHQFIHIDAERAVAETPFKGTIAHGFLSLSLLASFNETSFPKIIGRKMTINYGLDKVRFLALVRVNSKLRGVFTLTAVAERKRGQFQCKVSAVVEIEGNETPALIAEQILLFIMDEPI